MANLSQQRREQMLSFLETLKEQHNDDASLIAINQIEKELTSKKYGLVWEEHEEEVDVKMQTHIPVFTEVEEKEIVGNPESDQFNFLLEGDNLHSLKLLEKTHKGKIDVIYIDPPYNTGNKDFTYQDKYVGIEDSFRHSMWLSFMAERLKLAHTLLSSKGVIFISIDNNEFAQLKLLCDSIFGENSFVTNIHVELSATQGMKVRAAQMGNIVKNGEYILVYSKDGHKDIAKNVLYDYRPEYDGHYSRFLLDDMTTVDIKEVFSKEFPDVKLRNITDMFTEEPSFRKFVLDNVDKIYADDKITGFDLSDYPVGKVYYVEKNGRSYYIYNSGNKLRQLLPLKASFGRCDDFNASYGLRKIRGDWWKDFYKDMGNVSKEGDMVFTNGKKPVRLIKQIIKMSTDKNSIILDFFAGSGTTGHAVMEINKEDGGERKYILCTNNENSICEEVTYQRLKTVITGKRISGETYGEEILSNLKYYRTDFVDKDSSEICDELLNHIKEMIQLEYGVKVDNFKYVMIMDDEEMDDFEKNYPTYTELKAVFINQDVMLTTSQEKMLQDIDVKIIPDCYFDFELREVGELW